MASQHPPARTITVEEYRSLLARRLQADGIVDRDAAEHAELVFNLTRLQHRLFRDFEALHRRRGWTWAGFRIMNVLWAVGAAELRDVARLSGASAIAFISGAVLSELVSFAKYYFATGGTDPKLGVGIDVSIMEAGVISVIGVMAMAIGARISRMHASRST